MLLTDLPESALATIVLTGVSFRRVATVNRQFSMLVKDFKTQYETAIGETLVARGLGTWVAMFIAKTRGDKLPLAERRAIAIRPCGFSDDDDQFVYSPSSPYSPPSPVYSPSSPVYSP